MLSKPAKSNIIKLYALGMVRMFLIVLPVISIYFQDNGLSVQQIFYIQIFFAISLIIIEIPSGYFSDFFGRKNSLLLAALFGVLGWCIYFFVHTFSGFLLAEFFLALSSGFLSGTDSALLYDTLKDEGREKDYVKYEGKILSLRTAAEAVAALLSSVLLIYTSIHMLFFLQILIMLTLVPIALSIKKPHTKQKKPQKNILQIVRFAIHENKKLRYLNLFGAVLSASTLTFVWFAQPFWKSVHVPLVYFGIVWAFANILVSVSSLFAYKLDKRFSFKVLFGFFALVPIFAYGFLAVFAHSLHFVFVVALSMIFWIFRGVYNPIMRDYINKEAESSIRATVLSVQSLFNSLAFSILSPFLGWVADVWDFQTAFFISALFFGIPAIIFLILLLFQMTKTSP